MCANKKAISAIKIGRTANKKVKTTIKNFKTAIKS
jgi:hypothetical protein